MMGEKEETLATRYARSGRAQQIKPRRAGQYSTAQVGQNSMDTATGNASSVKPGAAPATSSHPGGGLLDIIHSLRCAAWSSASEPKPPGKRGKRRRCGKITPHVAIEGPGDQGAGAAGLRASKDTRATSAGRGAACRGGRYRRERWITPMRRRYWLLCRPAWSGIRTGLRRSVLAQHHQGQVTVPRLVVQLRGIGVSISKRQVMCLLIAGQDGFLTEARDVLRVGLETAAWGSGRFAAAVAET